MINAMMRENTLVLEYPTVSSNYRVHENAFKPYVAKSHDAKFYTSVRAENAYNRPAPDCTRSFRGRKHVRKSFRSAKLQISLLFIVMVVAAFIAGGFIFGQDAAGMETQTYETVRVMQGDTLWQIASTYAPNDTSIRNYIGEIQDINNLDNATIQAGMVLQVPV